MARPSNLTPKQQRFVAEYLIDLNATAAYKRAGYAGQGKVAENSASRLLGNVGVAAAVKDAIDKRSNDLGIDAKYVLTTIRDTIERCAQAVPVRDKEGAETGEYKFDSGAVLKGAELLGRHLKMFTDKVEHSGSIVTTLSDAELRAKIAEKMALVNGRAK